MSIDVNVQNDLVIVTESSEDITVNVSNAAGPAGANGVGVPVGGTTGQVLKKFTNTDFDTYWAADASGLTSVGISMPNAFAVSNSPLTTNGTISVTGAGTADQYVRGDGQLANFPTNQGGGSSVNYYLNGSVNQGTFGGDTYYEMSKTPIIGSGTNFTRTNAQGNGYIASFITDAGDPALLNIPGGNWNLEFYFAASSSGSTPSFYAELYKVSSSNVFTLIASGSTNPEGITQGTVVDQYFTSIPVPQTALLATDRIAIRIFVTPSGRNITLHTEDNNLCEVLTTFSTGLNALNGLTSQVQYFATGTSGTDFAISSATDTHTFNLPTASASNRGALSSADWTTFNGKVSGTGATGQVAYWNGTGSVTGSSNLTYSGGYLTNTNTATDSAILIIRPNQNTYQSFIGVGTVGAYSPTNLFWSFGLVPGNQDFNIQSFNGTTVSSRIKIYASTGNISLNAGANADGGQRLQVYGDAFVRGSGNTSATSALVVQDSSGSQRFKVGNDGVVEIANRLKLNTIAGLSTGTVNIDASFSLLNSSSGSYTRIALGSQSVSSSGNFTSSGFQDNVVTNITSTSTLDYTSFYANPTLTALTAGSIYKAFGWSNNSGWGLYGAGTAPNYLGGATTFAERINIEADSTITTQTSSAIVSTTSNANLIISANGTGSLLASIPTGTATGGNARGNYSLDLQRTRTSATQVTPTYVEYSTILNGRNNTCNALYGQVLNGVGNTINFANYSTVINGTSCTTSGNYSIASGESCTSNAYGFTHGFNNVNSGSASISLGWSSTVSNNYSFACGFQNQATALSSFVSGYRAIAYLRGQITNGYTPQSWDNPYYGLAQSSELVASSSVVALTTGATTDLTIDGDLIIPLGTNRFWNVEIKYIVIISAITGTATGMSVGSVKTQNIQIGLKKYLGTSTLVGTGIFSTAQEDSSMSTASLALSIGGSQNLRLTFTAPTFSGGGSVTCRVVAKIELTEVAY